MFGSQSGLRLQTLGNAQGDDGLTIRGLPELKVYKDSVELTRIPTRIVVRPSLSKIKHWYRTLTPKEGCDHLDAYLNNGLSEGEKLTPTTSLSATRMGCRASDRIEAKFMATRNVPRIIRDTMLPSFHWRPYVLRAYFDTQMLLADSHEKVSHTYRVYFMGHKREIEA